MDFDLTDAQRILKKSAHDFLSREFSKEVVRRLEDTEGGHSPELWRKMAELGWLGLLVPEEYGGSGGSFLELMVVLEEMGYVTYQGPFFSSVVLGGLPILMAGDEEQKEQFLPRLAEGSLLITLALSEPGSGYDASSITSRAIADETGYVVDGCKLFVPDALIADYILWVARTDERADPEDGITVFIVDTRKPGITRTPLRTLARDKRCEVVFDKVRAARKDVLGEPHRGWPLVRDAIEKAALARGAEMLGGAQAVMDMALAYAQERIQFDRPIGSFQAIQHYFADMWIDINGARILLYKAGWKVSNGLPASRDVAMAKARIGDSFRRVTSLGHQIFGAIGFTMEHDMHRYHRRSVSGALEFGDPDVQRERVAEELGLSWGAGRGNGQTSASHEK